MKTRQFRAVTYRFGAGKETFEMFSNISAAKRHAKKNSNTVVYDERDIVVCKSDFNGHFSIAKRD